jgi:DNA-binding transcriptional ArsR family regulator
LAEVDLILIALGDPTRRAIVEMLSVGARRAGEIQSAFPIADPAISRHLRVLREAGVVVERRIAEDGRVRLYELAPAPLEAVQAWLHGLLRPGQAQLNAFRDYVAARTPPVTHRATP